MTAASTAGVAAPEPFDAVDVIRTKRDKGTVSEDALRWMIDAYTREYVADSQMAAFAMAVLLNGMTRDEIRVMTDAMSALLLLEPQSPAEHGVVGQLGVGRRLVGAQFVGEPSVLQEPARGLPVFLVDQNAPRQDAERAFQHAHVLVEHQMMNRRGLQQRFDRGDQHGVVGADEFAHALQLRRRSSAGARCAR